jgi:hypothetical protein
MAVRHPGGERPGELQVFDVIDFDLIERAIASAGLILGRHQPLAIVGLILDLRKSSRYKDESGKSAKRLHSPELPPIGNISDVSFFSELNI